MQTFGFSPGKIAHPFLLCFFLTTQLLPACRSAKQQEAEAPIFLIPAGYQGSLSVVYDQKCGVKPEKENGKPVYRFPADGVLILQEKDSYYNRAASAYYFLDSAGNRQEITQVIDRAPSYTTNPKGDKKYMDRGNTNFQNLRKNEPVIVIKGMGINYLDPVEIVAGEPIDPEAASFGFMQYGVYTNQGLDTAALIENPNVVTQIESRIRTCAEAVSAAKKSKN